MVKLQTYAPLAALLLTTGFAMMPVCVKAANLTTTTTTQTTEKTWNTSAGVEQRIQTLHDKLQITPDQEADWQKVATTMRENNATAHELIEQRRANPDSMTAIDDLQSYQQLAQAHADGLQKLTADFGTLYNEMSDSQRANADEVFGRFEGHREMTKVKHTR